MRRLAPWVSCTLLLASAQAQPPPAAPGIGLARPIRCVEAAFTTPVISSIVPRDVGGGAVEAEVYMIAGGPPSRLSARRAGHDVYARLEVPDGSLICRGRLRLTGLAPGSYTLHLVAPNAWVSAPAGRRPGPDGEVARAGIRVH